MEPLTAGDPRSIGGYELRARLGAGGFGRVYLGLSPGGRAVAIKVLRPELTEDQEFLRRFRSEVAAARQVNGFYTAQVVAAGLDDQRPWVATAFVSGPPLGRVVVANGPLDELALWRLLAGLVEALEAIHGCGLVHRDLKPANVLLAADGPRVIDFGISKAIDGTAMTSTGVLIGTPSFMAPEQVDSRAVSQETDVFTLGSVLAYAAMGKLPFRGDSYASILYRIAHGDPVLDGVPLKLRPVLEGCLAKIPAARPTLAELARIGRDGPGTPAAQSSLAFWPPQLGQLIRDYQSQFETAGVDGTQEAPVPAAGLVVSPAKALRSPGSVPYDQMRATPVEEESLSATTQQAVRPLRDVASGRGTASGPVSVTAHRQDAAPAVGDRLARRTDGGDPDHGKPSGPGPRGSRRWLPWAVSGVVVIAAIIVAAVVLNVGGRLPVPGVDGKTQAQAVAVLDAAGLKPVFVAEADSRVRSGLVISSTPAAGSTVKKGQAVTVYVSTGPSVPSVTGLPWPQAEVLLKAAGFVPAENEEASASVKTGLVISTNPVSGRGAPPPGRVTVNVSTGPAALTLPDLLSRSGTAAKTQLRNLGFTDVGLVLDAGSTAPAGTVVRMTPAPGSYPPGRQITLYESAGGITVPDVVNLPATEAEAILQQDGFYSEEESVSAPSSMVVGPGTVYNQNPGTGTLAPQGATIQIFVQPASTGDNGNGNGGGFGGL